MENKLARFFRNTGLLRFLLPIGLVLIIFGSILLANTPKEYAQTKGVVTNVTEYVDTEDNQARYDMEIEYTVDGVKHTTTFPGETTKPNVGDEVTVFYDPANPDKASNTDKGGVIGPVMIGLGAIAIVGGVLSAVKAFRKSRELDEQIKAEFPDGKIPVVTPLPKEQLTEYYVSFDGKSLKPGYIVEDGARNVVYEAAMAKNALIGSRTFTFTDHKTGRSEDHEVGHTMTSSFDNEVFSAKSWFKFDGKNIWDLLHERGVRIATSAFSKFPNFTYTVSIKGRFAATVETSSKYVHEEDEAEHKLVLPIGKYYYRVWTNEPELELIFLTVFAISETEQTIVE